MPLFYLECLFLGLFVIPVSSLFRCPSQKWHISQLFMVLMSESSCPHRKPPPCWQSPALRQQGLLGKDLSLDDPLLPKVRIFPGFLAWGGDRDGTKTLARRWHCESGAMKIGLCLNPLRMICRGSSKVPLCCGVMPVKLLFSIMSSCSLDVCMVTGWFLVKAEGVDLFLHIRCNTLWWPLNQCVPMGWFWYHPSLCLQHLNSSFGAADVTADLTAHLSQNLWCFNSIRSQQLIQKPVSRQSYWLLQFYASCGYAVIYSWVPKFQPCICGFRTDGFVVAVCSQN